MMAGICAILTATATGQVPDTLKHSIPPPPTGVQSGAQLGYSVAVDAGYTVVAAPRDDVGGQDSGVVKVFDSTSGSLLFVVPNPSPAEDDNFGHSVAISGTRVVVGAIYDNTGANGAGSAYVYDLSTGTPTVPVATLNNPSPVAFENFGNSVAISGTRLVVGAPYDNTGANGAGSAYVYDLSSGTPTVPVVTLNNPGSAAGVEFGSSVAISGTRVVVGAYADDTGANNAGSAYVYDLSSGTPTVPVATLNNPGPAAGDFFGYSVAISGTRVVVGAYADDTGANNAGSAYAYDLSGATPTVPVATLSNPGPAASDQFGFSVGISGTRVVVGAYADDTGGFNVGSAYIYDLSSGTPTVPVATLNNPDPAALDNFGYSVAISGTRVVVGAYADDTGATDAGSAYVYDLSGGTPTVPVVTLNNPGPAVGDFFGTSVAISGTRVVVGAYADDTGATDAGSAYVFDLSGGTPTVPVATLNNPGPAASESFGNSVAIDGTTVAIGNPSDDTVVAGKGYAYVFGPASNDFDNDGLLDIWEYARFGSISALSGLDDSDGDGRVELLEQAFNTNPLLPDVAGAPQAVDEGGYLTMTIAKRAGVTYSVQSASRPTGSSFSTVNTTVLVNDATTLKVRDNVVVGSLLSRFMRVKVTSAP